MASKAATVAASGPMSMAEWRDYLGVEHAETLPHADVGQSHQKPLDPSAKCPHGQYSAAYCGLCSDLHYDEGYKVVSPEPIERKEVLCERCFGKGLDRCNCKLERRYTFISEDDDGFNMEVRPDEESASVPCGARVLGPERMGNLWHYTDVAFAEADLYCQVPIVHRPLNYEDGRVLGGYVKNPALPFIRKFAFTRNEIETRWYKEMRWHRQSYEPWQEKVYIAYRVRVAQRWRAHWIYGIGREEPPYFREWAIEAMRLHIPSPIGLLRHCCKARRIHECKGKCRERYEGHGRFKEEKPVRLTAKTLALELGISERTARRRLREMRETAYAPVLRLSEIRLITAVDILPLLIARAGGRMRPYFWPAHEFCPSKRSTAEERGENLLHKLLHKCSRQVPKATT